MKDELLYGKMVDSKDSNYIVKTGDTVWSIARKFTGCGEDYIELKDKNPFIKDITKLVIGELLIIPSHWVRLKELKIVKDRKMFGYEMTKILYEKWISFYRLNSPKGIDFHTTQGRLMTPDEVISCPSVNKQHIADIAVYWVLTKRFEGIFKIVFCGDENTAFLNIGDRYYTSVNGEGLPGIPEFNSDTPAQEIPFSEILERYVSNDEARLIVAYHQLFNIPPNQVLIEMIGF